MPDYLEAISAAYQAVQQGSSDPSAVLQALQYENWQNLPADLQAKIKNHGDYDKLDPAAEQPAEGLESLVKRCNSSLVERKSVNESTIFRLARVRVANQGPGSIRQFEQDKGLWFEANKASLFSNETYLWCSQEQQPCGTESQWLDCILALGLFHYNGTDANYYVYYFSINDAECVAPTILDAKLTGYFYQPKPGEKSMTRNLGGGELGVRECLALKQFIGDLEQTQLIHADKLSSALVIDFAPFIRSHAQRIQEQNKT